MNRKKGFSVLAIIFTGAAVIALTAGAFIFIQKPDIEIESGINPATDEHKFDLGQTASTSDQIKTEEPISTTTESGNEAIQTPTSPLTNTGTTPTASPGQTKKDTSVTQLSTSNPVSGTPANTASSSQPNTIPSIFTFTTATSVNSSDETAIRKGITISDKYLRQWFGKSITKPTEIKIYPDNSNISCCYINDGLSNTTITFHTGHANWQQATLASLLFTDLRPQMAMHELVHIYQGQYGCGRQDQPVQIRWLQEGMAEWLSYKMLSAEGIITDYQALIFNTTAAKMDTLMPLKNYEAYTQGMQYFTFYLAVNQLMNSKPIQTLNTFCENLGKGLNGPEAFQSTFGISLQDFYNNFETYRSTL